MRIFCVLSLVAFASAAIIPFDGLRQQSNIPDVSAIETSPNPETTILNDEGYSYKTVRRLKYRQRRDVTDVSPEYLPPAEEGSGTEESAAVEELPHESAVLGDNGYEYKTVRRLKYRHRRDVSEFPSEYLPPSEETTTEAVAEVKSDDESQDSAVLGNEGYEYKTVRRLTYRQRRDVSEIVNEYLPPSEEAATETAAVEEPQDSAVLGDEGYEYKTVRRLKYRQRRDVSEIANEYLPPSEEAATETIAVEEVVAVEEPQDSAVLGDAGYEYKTVRRLKYRQRRDVSEIANEYLPPSEEGPTETVVVEEAVVVEEPQDSAVLGDEGYEYKTVRRLKHRQRRDVSEITNEYLHPSEEAATETVVVEEAVAVEEPQDSAVLGDEGYEYKTVRRLKYRQRRDVSEIANEYLPPSEEAVTETIPEIKSNDEPQDSAVLGDEGYEYKTVRRLKYRQRRDVSEIANEYLPPTEESDTENLAEIKSIEEPQDSALLGDEGYEYKTVRRLKYRQRRDVSEIANEYLPPSEEAATETVAAEEAVAVEEPQDSAVLGTAGYEYKTVRRLKYRQRRDVSEIANEYLPPSEEGPTETVAEIKSNEEPKDSTVLGDEGYEYKTVRRLKYRQRRDVSAIANEYLPPSEEGPIETVAEIKSNEEPQDSAVLGDEGYEYKTVRRLKYRQRRDVSEIANEYLPPTEESDTENLAEIKSIEEPQDSAVLGDEGYEYKTVRRLKYRQRRDVSEIANEYLPPSEEAATETIAAEEAVAVEEPQDSALLGDEGYEYKTVRRLKYRQRRDVSEIVNEYLPPSEEAATETIAEIKSSEEPQDSAVLGDEGYEYKTVRRLKYRQRRDVSEIANEYLPPSEEAATETVAVEEAVEEPQDSAVLGDEGYEYKTVRRVKYRQRRDVSEIANDYLPPSEEAATETVAAEEAVAVEEPQDSALLGDEGYEYKTVRRLKYRQRRDVSEIANEYLPPSEEAATETVAVEEAVEEPQDSAVLGDEGYEYKTVRRLKYRQRRDVSEIVNEYLPPSEEAATETIAEIKSSEEPQDSAVLGDEGYEYKTVRRLKYRQRRDVSEIANEYLPPSEEAATETVAVEEAVEEPQDSAVLGDEGYEYKTVRRVKYRQRRDVSEIANDYLPPSEEAATETVAAEEAVEEPQDSAVLGDEGYEYKTVRRLKYRQRRDVSEIANDYLPPSEEAATETVAAEEAVAVEEPQDSAVLGDEGYEYKTVRRLKYRQRRDVSEIANDYLPPSEEAATETVAAEEAVAVEKPQDSAVLGDEGYEYKTVRRLKYRQRRDVSEIANDYLPPSEEAATETVAAEEAVEEPQDSAVLGDEGYEYKTVRRLKYRQRRDVSDIGNDYLPPSEEAATETVAVEEAVAVEEPQDSAVLGDEGYEYKTVRRLKYRQRRDVSEIANDYLPPSEEAATETVAVEEAVAVEEPQDSAVLGDEGYEYKTVRRLKYRQRRDVSEIVNEYLPPSEEAATETVAVEDAFAVEGPQDSAILGDEGYEYKTVRRLKYRQRRDVSEIVNEYLPPSEEAATETVAEIKSSEEPQESAVLGDEGYEYKTVRRLKHRQRRDVSEIVNEYLPPSEEAATETVAVEEAVAVEEPQDSAVLGNEGYEYKTVRRLKYRQRRDVSEIANDYLPPSEYTVSEIVPEVKVEEVPQESAVLSDNGYEYKTIRRLKYRHRRDVSEIANEYLPPSVEVSIETVGLDKSEETPQDSAVLGQSGYEYKTVRRLKF